MPAVNNHTDLISRIRNGDETVFREMYREHFKMVEYLVKNNGGSVSDANDVFQDSLLVLMEKARNTAFELTSSLKTYLYSVARNIWRGKRRGKEGTNLDISDFEEFLPLEDGIEMALEKEKESTIASLSLQQLGEPCKSLMNQFYYLKKSMAEIAAILGYKDTNAAKSQKYKCLQRLRKIALQLKSQQ